MMREKADLGQMIDRAIVASKHTHTTLAQSLVEAAEEKEI